ncbi:unnamed protein product [Brachionus calyciflorus]|uniref:EGF-like domain-containing protein n=1 Tax=Brachionus calyciflorus TaxID=104777 RepID=A0A813MF32_9BILA|nr:unnamed protein product [Brachionus calyciflorus]
MSKVFTIILLGLVLVFQKSEARSLSKRAAIGLCSNGICLNRARCFQIGYNLATCICEPEFSGIYCEIPPKTTRPPVTVTQPVLCTPGVCNGGQCVQLDNLNLAICICPEGLSGIYCEIGGPSTTKTALTSSVIPTVTSTLSAVTPSGLTTTIPQSYFTTCPSSVPADFCKNNGFCLLAGSSRFVTCVCPPPYTSYNCEK